MAPTTKHRWTPFLIFNHRFLFVWTTSLFLTNSVACKKFNKVTFSAINKVADNQIIWVKCLLQKKVVACDAQFA